MDPRKAQSSESQLFAIEQKTCSELRFAWREKRMNEAWSRGGGLRRYISFFMHFDPKNMSKNLDPF